MKYDLVASAGRVSAVTPFTGVWIEMRCLRIARSPASVTPFTGVWIEIGPPLGCGLRLRRHTLHGCVD